MEQCDLDTEESSVLEHKEYAENIGASRDTVKIRKSLPYMAWNLLYWEWKDRSIFIMRCPCG